MRAAEMFADANSTVSDRDRDALWICLIEVVSTDERAVRGAGMLENIPKQLADRILNRCKALRIVLEMEERRDRRDDGADIVSISNLRDRKETAGFFALAARRGVFNSEMFEQMHAPCVVGGRTKVVDAYSHSVPSAPVTPRCEHRQPERLNECLFWMKAKNSLIAGREEVVLTKKVSGIAERGECRKFNKRHRGVA